MTARLQPHERPWCDKIAWDLVFDGPVLLESFIQSLMNQGASSEEVKQCARLLGLIIVGEHIGHGAHSDEDEEPDAASGRAAA